MCMDVHVCMCVYMVVHVCVYGCACVCVCIILYVPRCVGVFNQLQKRRQEYIRDLLGYICDVPQ